MKLYHGSNTIITNIDLSKSLSNKDFGCGFYLSDDLNQAKEMAKFKAQTYGGVDIVTTFEINDSWDSIDSINVKKFENYSMEWAEFIVANRKNSSRTNIHDYDIIYGPIADDKVGAQIRKLENGDIDIDLFLKRIKFMKGVTFQYFFATDKAVKLLKRI